MFTYPPSLTFRFTLREGEESAESSQHETWLCSTGVFRLDTQGGQGHPNTDTYYYREPSIWHLSLPLWNTSSVLQEVINCSNTNWNNPQPQASPYTWPWKLRCREANFSRRWCDMVVVVVVDRSVGVKALDCSFERLWFNRQFLLSLQSNIPQCELVQSLSSTITWLRPFLILPPSSPLLLVSFR